MKSQNLPHIPALDHLRFLAALLVFAFHLFHYYFGQWQPAPYAAWIGLMVEGHTGVALFFVLSGFLFMTMAQQGGVIRYGPFMRNRFLRIFPLFVFFFVIAISLGREEFRAADVLYLFFSNIGQPPTSRYFITGAAWTISVEFTFYLVFPFLARFALQEGAAYLLRLMALMLLVKIAAYGISAHPTHMFYSTLIGRFDQFLWGMLAAMVWQRRQAWLQRHGRKLLPAALLVIWGVTAWMARHASYFSPQQHQPAWVIWGSIEALAWAFVVLAYLGARIAWPAWLARSLGHGGAWSYSIYLWHALLIFVVHHYLGVWKPTDSVAINCLVNFCVLLPPTLLLAALSYHTIERPFLRMRGPYLQDRPTCQPAHPG